MVISTELGEWPEFGLDFNVSGNKYQLKGAVLQWINCKKNWENSV